MAAGPRWRWPARSSPRPATAGWRSAMIAADGTPVYGPTAIYVAPTPGDPAEGPFVAPADVLLTDARYRSKQAATTEDPFVAVYGADVEFPKKGQYAVLATTKKPDGTLTGATGQVDVSTEERRPDPGASATRRRRSTRTRSRRAKGDVAKIDTRDPAERHARRRLRRRRRQEAGRAAVLDAAAVPVARVRPGDRHRAADEVQVRRQDGLHPPGGLRRQRHQQGPARAAAGSSTCRPSRGCSSSTSQGKITARLEGSIGVQQFEDAVKSGL